MTSNPLRDLKLDRPLVCFDLESTGLSIISDRIIQLGYIKYTAGEKQPVTANLLFNPEMPIPASATAVHGLTDQDVLQAPRFKDQAQELLDIFSDCYYSGFNVAGFDLLLLKQEFLRAGLNFSYRSADVIDTKTIYHHFEPRTLSSAYQYYCQKEHKEAHDALADAQAAADILAAQVKRYGATEIQAIQQGNGYESFDSEGKFYWKDEQLYFSFSKHKHRALAEVVEQEPTFLEWMLGADFSPEVKQIVKDALQGKFPTKK